MVEKYSTESYMREVEEKLLSLFTELESAIKGVAEAKDIPSGYSEGQLYFQYNDEAYQSYLDALRALASYYRSVESNPYVTISQKAKDIRNRVYDLESPQRLKV